MSKPSGGASFSLIAHSIGLIVIYSAYGVLQERIIRHGVYGANEEKFESSSLLILCNRIFSVSTGMAILAYKAHQTPAHGSFTQRLRPSSPMFAYAAVAVSNFLSTMCQYEALRYVSYTTQSLAKCSKMIPVLVVGALIYKKKHLPREWVAGAVIAVGCGTYLFSQPPRHSSHAAEVIEGDAFTNMLFGTFFLVGYLFFDGLVSTTQERVFGKNPSSSDPFGPESPVLDQMIWTNVFAGLLAVIVAITDVSGTLGTSLRLLFTSIPLLWDVCIFSAASATGLILLLNTIASFGALTSSLVMTIRQFLSILINAGAFGNFGTVGLDGWCGVGWVASGIYIKMNRSFDPPKKAGPGTADEMMGLTNKEAIELSEPPKKTGKQFLWQYVFPVAVPVIFVIFISPFVDPQSTQDIQAGAKNALNAAADRWAHGTSTNSHSGIADAFRESTGNAAPVNEDKEGGDLIGEPVDDDPLTPVLTSEEIDDGLSPDDQLEADAELEAAIESADVVDLDDSTDDSIASSEAESDALANGESDDLEEMSLAGGSWDAQLHKAVNPKCPVDLTTTAYNGDIRTGFVSYPRSGNSYMRSLIERTTGYQTSSVYCDTSLEKTFLGECNHKTTFFVKTHYPSLGSDDLAKGPTYYKQFDQVLHLVRNPLDAAASWWHLNNARSAKHLDWADSSRHSAKIENKVFGEADRHAMETYFDRWDRHTTYWAQSPILRHQLRYEDLKAQPIPNMMSLLSFLLPEDDLPGLEKLACMIEEDHSHEAYKSRSADDFVSWNDYEPALRSSLLKRVRKNFCKLGYDRVLRRALGDVSEMRSFCESVKWNDN